MLKITELFDKHSISYENIDIKNCFIEEYHTKKKFDIAICENMLSGIENKYEVIKKIDTLIAEAKEQLDVYKRDEIVREYLKNGLKLQMVVIVFWGWEMVYCGVHK